MHVPPAWSRYRIDFVAASWRVFVAARLSALKVRMDAVLAKPHAGVSELALVNLELGTATREIESESQRCASGASTKARHEAAMKAIR